MAGFAFRKHYNLLTTCRLEEREKFRLSMLLYATIRTRRFLTFKYNTKYLVLVCCRLFFFPSEFEFQKPKSKMQWKIGKKQIKKKRKKIYIYSTKIANWIKLPCWSQLKWIQYNTIFHPYIHSYFAYYCAVELFSLLFNKCVWIKK